MRKLTNKKGQIDLFWIMLLIFLAVIFGLLLLISLVEKGTNNARWNNGYCPDCETKWRYIQAVGHRSDTKYIWVCDKCGKSIEVNNEPDWRTVKTGELNENN